MDTNATNMCRRDAGCKNTAEPGTPSPKNAVAVPGARSPQSRAGGWASSRLPTRCRVPDHRRAGQRRERDSKNPFTNWGVSEKCFGVHSLHTPKSILFFTILQGLYLVAQFGTLKPPGNGVRRRRRRRLILRVRSRSVRTLQCGGVEFLQSWFFLIKRQ